MPSAQARERSVDLKKSESTSPGRPRVSANAYAERGYTGEDSPRLGKNQVAFDGPVTMQTLHQVIQKIAEGAQGQNGFIYPRGDGYHILFDESEMSQYFGAIRYKLSRQNSGAVLANALKIGKISQNSSNHAIWTCLVRSLKFSGVDFEHAYSILPGCADHVGAWDYNFEETIVLSHTLLLVPVMQFFSALKPKLDVKHGTLREHGAPLLVVGMIGDCVKGPFFNEVKERAENGDMEAIRQRDTLLSPSRLQQKFRGFVDALIHACPLRRRLRLDATLVGAGAFGGAMKVLAQPFANSLKGLALDRRDEVNYFMFPPPAGEDFAISKLQPMEYGVNLNPEEGLCATSGADDILRVVVAGFDPVSLAPHGMKNRVFSGEGQLCHATDLLARLTEIEGMFVVVDVPEGCAWESPAAFFAKPQELKTKVEESYKTVRFVPKSELQDYKGERIIAKAREAPRVWNGDAFEGWTLKGPTGFIRTWQEILNHFPRPDGRWDLCGNGSDNGGEVRRSEQQEPGTDVNTELFVEGSGWQTNSEAFPHRIPSNARRPSQNDRRTNSHSQIEEEECRSRRSSRKSFVQECGDGHDAFEDRSYEHINEDARVQHPSRRGADSYGRVCDDDGATCQPPQSVRNSPGQGQKPRGSEQRMQSRAPEDQRAADAETELFFDGPGWVKRSQAPHQTFTLCLDVNDKRAMKGIVWKFGPGARVESVREGCPEEGRQNLRRGDELFSISGMKVYRETRELIESKWGEAQRTSDSVELVFFQWR
eukprot:TRINITY_DN3082_c0_g1_i5.p1 TRINITY_DN3082_c0_g1~~TRINITY_DN3082_c0_g1_i5.p1  ORF type:complete len:782 (+),score=117.24 TRINITY_DN3082_c0_g1_i5:54-2348(+)